LVESDPLAFSQNTLSHRNPGKNVPGNHFPGPNLFMKE